MKITTLKEVKLQVKAIFLVLFKNSDKLHKQWGIIFGVFAAQQVNEICNSSKTKEWFYVHRNQYEADDLTRYKEFYNFYLKLDQISFTKKFSQKVLAYIP